MFQLRRNTKLKKLLKAYCVHESVEMSSVSFLFNGRVLSGDQTPVEVLDLSWFNSPFSLPKTHTDVDNCVIVSHILVSNSEFCLQLGMESGDAIDAMPHDEVFSWFDFPFCFVCTHLLEFAWDLIFWGLTLNHCSLSAAGGGGLRGFSFSFHVRSD